MLSHAARVMRSNLRAWWPELAFAAFLGLFLLIRAKDGALFVAVEALVMFAGWMMGFRHRHRPIIEVIRRMDTKLDQALAEDDEPAADVRHLHSV